MSHYLTLALRLLLGAVFIYAGWVKVREPWQLFAMAVDAYGLLPQWAVILVARTLPWAEIVIGVALAVGPWLRWASGAASLLLTGFMVAMVRSYIAGLQIDCACFGPGDTISAWTLTRDSLLLVASLALTWLAWRGRFGTNAGAAVPEAPDPAPVQ